MSELKRLVESSSSSSSAALSVLRAGLRDNPSPRSAERAALALGLSSAVASAATASSALGASVASSGSVALAAQGAAAATSAAGASASAVAMATKWVLVGFLGGGAVVGAASSISGLESVSAPPQAPHAAESSEAKLALQRAQRATLHWTPPPNASETSARRDVAIVTAVPSAAKNTSTAALRTAAAPPLVAASGRAVSMPPLEARSAGGLGRDLALIEATRQALKTGNASQAIAKLDAYERARETQFFDREAVVLRIEALLQRGDRARALQLANDYFGRFPGDVHVPRLRRLLQAPGAQTSEGK